MTYSYYSPSSFFLPVSLAPLPRTSPSHLSLFPSFVMLVSSSPDLLELGVALPCVVPVAGGAHRGDGDERPGAVRQRAADRPRRPRRGRLQSHRPQPQPQAALRACVSVSLLFFIPPKQSEPCGFSFVFFFSLFWRKSTVLKFFRWCLSFHLPFFFFLIC